jgi:hypothetical protein
LTLQLVSTAQKDIEPMSNPSNRPTLDFYRSPTQFQNVHSPIKKAQQVQQHNNRNNKAIQLPHQLRLKQRINFSQLSFNFLAVARIRRPRARLNLLLHVAHSEEAQLQARVTELACRIEISRSNWWGCVTLTHTSWSRERVARSRSKSLENTVNEDGQFLLLTCASRTHR